MQAENDLATLLAGMEPVLWDAPYGFGLLPDCRVLPEGVAFATVREAEGLTVIAPVDVLSQQDIPAQGRWARISLTVHSDLAAVGLTAAIATALAQEGISSNMVAGFFHDHVFVQWERRADAMAALTQLTVRRQ